MKFFLDTAKVEEIKKAKAMGILDGVTTNPTLVAKTGRKFDEVVKEIIELVDGPISLEVISTKTEGMIKEAQELAKLSPNVVIKIPLIPDGLVAVRQLKELGIRTNVTLCFTATQALLAAKAGASYVSPFIGRLDDISSFGMNIVSDIKTIFNNYGYETEIIVASIRHPIHVLDAALIGADIATIPYSVFEKLVKHPLTDIGIERFLADWEKVPKE
ncbi:fructose-6-phosphate aldolase [Candidatus Sumerlaeota bacterium]|nr:fructose-6-phosphate aldolase [Candidatus Sumerlaeota bacterium]